MSPAFEPVQVVAGILIEEGRVMLAQRTAAQSFPLCWEFPGGKIEPGETAEAALVREWDEEMGFVIRVLEPYAEVAYEKSPGRPVVVRFFRVARVEGEPKPIEVAAVDWVAFADLPARNFIPRNQPVAERLAKEGS